MVPDYTVQIDAYAKGVQPPKRQPKTAADGGYTGSAVQRQDRGRDGGSLRNENVVLWNFLSAKLKYPVNGAVVST